MKRIIKIIILSLSIAAIFSATSFVDAGYRNNWDKIFDEYDIHRVDAKENARQIEIIERGNITYKADIQSFDINDKYIVIAFSDDTIGLFDKNMNLLYGYKCNSWDKSCGVLLNGENIVIFYGGGNYATEITKDMGFVALYSVEMDMHALDETFFVAVRKFGSYTYHMSDDKEGYDGYILSNAPYFIKEDEDGNKTVLYDVYKYHIRRRILFISSFVLFFMSIIGSMIFMLYRNKKRKERSEYINPYSDNELYKKEIKRTINMINAMDDNYVNPLSSSTEFRVCDDREKYGEAKTK